MSESAIQNESSTRTESSFQKVAADLRQYALRQNCQPNLAFGLRMFLLTPGFQFVFSRRFQEILYRIPLMGRLLGRVWWWFTCLVFGSELAIGCEIGGGLYIPHPFGIVVGTCKIGRNVTILQNVTIGHRGRLGNGEPLIGNNVSLTAGCVILGNVTIGDQAVVGANAVVTRDVPPGFVAMGVPARTMPRKGFAGSASESN